MQGEEVYRMIRLDNDAFSTITTSLKVREIKHEQCKTFNSLGACTTLVILHVQVRNMEKQSWTGFQEKGII